VEGPEGEGPQADGPEVQGLFADPGAESVTRRFWFLLAVVALFGLVVRIAYIAASRQAVQGDGTYYHAIAGVLADGKGFVQPNAYLSSGQSIPWAPHPPLWPLLLALPARIGLRTYTEQQLFAALVGTATVVVIGLAGRRLLDSRVGLIAAAVAAVYPNFFLYVRDLLAETLAIFLMASTLLLAFRFKDRPGLGRAAAVGAGCGLLALTRSEQALLILLLLVPLLLLAPHVAWRQRLTWLAISVTVAVAVIAPWTAYNAPRFDHLVLLSHELGPTMVEANCDAVYSGSNIGYRSGPCLVVSPAGRIGPGGDGSTRDAATRHEALDYIHAHLSRVPWVVLAREGRAWGVFRPIQQIRFEAGRGTRPPVVGLGFAAYWLLSIAAVGGVIILRRRHVAVFPLMAPLLTAAVAIALTFGSVRYRTPADVSIVLLAAVAMARATRTVPATGES
jgi:4-amino-4-deoxy-L-arabinose transferase-like glycosyltransferase